MDEHNPIAAPEDPTLIAGGKAAPIVLWTFMGALGLLTLLMMTL